MFAITILKALLVILSIYLTFFTLWRSLEREHVDDVPLALDRVIIASIVAWYLSRLPSGVDMLLRHTISPLALLSPMSASASWQVGVVLFCVSFYLLLRENWRDKYGLLDNVIVAVPIFLAGYMAWQAVTLVLSTLIGKTELPIAYLITLILGAAATYGISRLLVYFERSYRAYFWYRYRRSSAQTGFVTCAFLIVIGFLGILSNLYQIPYAIVSLPMFYTVWSLLTMVGGFVLLYIRSGRLKKK